MSSSTINATQEQLADCEQYTGCGTCTANFPECAWCSTSRKCLPSTSELIQSIKHAQILAHSGRGKAEGPHVIYKVEDYQATYGSSVGQPSSSVLTGDCGVWVYAPRSCERVGQHCSPYSSCQSCTSLDGCGFCYQSNFGQDPVGECKPGVARTSMGLSWKDDLCKPETPAEWIFGDWKQVYEDGLWEPPCRTMCTDEQVRLQELKGTLALGSSEMRVSYPADSQCSWLLEPDPWPQDKLLKLTMTMAGLLNHGDVVRLHTASGPKQIAHLGCDLALKPFSTKCETEDCCTYKSSFAVSEPIIISFISLPLGDQKYDSTGAWSISWSLEEPFHDSGTLAIEETGGFRLWWIGFFVLVIPLGFIIWLLRRGRLCPSPQQLPGDEAAYPRQQRATHVDIAELERNMPECRPRIIGASLSNDEPEPVVCSVCLGTPWRGQAVRRLPCSHEFHRECIDVWLRKSVHCPLCRQQINTYSTTPAQGGEQIFLGHVVPAEQIPSSSREAGGSAHMSNSSELAVTDVEV